MEEKEKEVATSYWFEYINKQAATLSSAMGILCYAGNLVGGKFKGERLNH